MAGSDIDDMLSLRQKIHLYFILRFLKRSYDVVKNIISLCIWCNAMCFCGSRFKKHIFHILYIIVAPPFWNALIVTKLMFWEARCALIGQISSELWLVEHLKRVTEILRPFPCCDAVSRRDNIKTIKPIINEVFVAFSEDIIIDYNDSYSLFMHRAEPRKYYVCMCDCRNAKQALLYTA